MRGYKVDWELADLGCLIFQKDLIAAELGVCSLAVAVTTRVRES